MKPLLPESCCHLTYAAFRAAFVTIIEHLLTDAMGQTGDRPARRGLFDGFPTLNAVAPQVQLECLLRTWNRSCFGMIDEPDVLDECVILAAGNCLARMAQDENRSRLQSALNGPCEVQIGDDLWLTTRARCLQVAGPKPHSSGFFREFESLEQQSQLADFSEPSSSLVREDLLEMVGRWAADRDTVLSSTGLLTTEEQAVLTAFFEEHPGRLRS